MDVGVPTLKKEDSAARAVDREDDFWERNKALKRRSSLEERCRREEAAAEAKTKAQLEASEQRLARDRSEASAAAEKALQREATRVLRKQEREKQKAVREACEQRARELKAAKALAQREREDAERARRVPYSCTNILCFVGLAVAAFLMRNSLCSLLVKLATVLIVGGVFALVALVVGVFAHVVLAQWMHPSELTTCSRLLLAGFVVLSLLHLTVFTNATSAMLQGSTYPGFQAGEIGVDSRASGPQESVLMQSSPVTFLDFVCSLAWVVLIALNLYTEHVLFLGLAVACCVGFKPCALALSLFLASVDSYVVSEFALSLLVYVGRPLGLRLDVHAYAQSHFLCRWAGLVFGSLDMIWWGGDLNWKMVTLMGGGASSTRSSIGCFISSMASWLYSQGSEVVSLWPELFATLICIFAISTVIGQFSEHLVVRLVCYFGGSYLVNATGDPWIVIKQALAVICIEGLALYVTSSRVASSESTSGIGHCCSTETTISNSVPGAAFANASCACASSDVDVDECGGADGTTECSCFTRLVTAFKWFVYGFILLRSGHLDTWFEMFGTASSASGDAIVTYLTRGMDYTGSVNVYAVLSVASGTGPAVVAILLVACSSWAALRDRRCLEGGGGFIRVGTAATAFALFIYCFVTLFDCRLAVARFYPDVVTDTDSIALKGCLAVVALGGLLVYLCSGTTTSSTSFISRPAMAQSKARNTGAITRLFDLIGQSISGYPVVQHRLLGGGKQYYCTVKGCTHKGSFSSSQKLASHKRWSHITTTRCPDPKTAPEGCEETPWQCFTCKTQKALNALGQMCWTCRRWREEGHPGHPDYVAFRWAKIQRDTKPGGKSAGDDITKWNEPYPGGPVGETRRQALENHIKAFPRWRLSPQKPLCEHFAQLLGVNHWKTVAAELSRLDPANTDGYSSTLRYEAFVNACLKLVNFDGGDPMFGGLDPLTVVLLGGLVSGVIALEAATLIRAMKSPQRRNAAGTQSRKGVDIGIYHSADGGNELAAALLENNRRSGLRGEGSGSSWFARRWGHLGGFDLGLFADCLVQLRDRGLQVFRIAPHGLSSFIGCDFGNLAKQATVLQAFNAKAPGEGLVGDFTTRTVSRPGNNAIAAGLSTYTGATILELHIKLHSGLIIVYTGICGVDWKAKVIAAYKHFSETYDPEVFKQKMKFPRCWDLWFRDLLVENGCGGVVDGYDMCFNIDGVRYGRDLLREAMDLAIYDATDRNLLRIARGISWDLSYLPNDEWPGVKSLRQDCLEACMSAADDALMIYWVVFKEKLEAALELGEGVCDVVTACYGSIRDGFERAASAEEALELIRAEFLELHAPGILADLAEPRSVDILTYDCRDLEKAPVPRVETVDRATSLAAARVETVDRATSLAAAPAPAPPALQPYNAAKRGSSADAGGDAKRTCGPADFPMVL